MKKFFTQIKNGIKWSVIASFLFPTISYAQFSISGYISQPDSINPNVTMGAVLLFKYDPGLPVFPKLDSVNIGFDGDYLFDSLPPGNYLIIARPDPGDYPTLMPTYYGDTVYWSGATVLTLDSSSLLYKNINVKKRPSWIASNNYCSGTLNFGSGKTTPNPLGDPVPGVDVSLEQIPGGVMRHTTTNQQGMFSFGNIPDSSTYKVVVDMPGVDIPSPFQISMTTGDTINNLNYDIDVVNGTIIIAAVRTIAINRNGIKIFPNPSSGMVMLNASGFDSKTYSLTISNVLGEKMFEANNLSQQVMPLDLGNFSRGIYFITVSSGDKIFTEKILLE